MLEIRKKSSPVQIGNVVVGGDAHWALIAGPCAIENRDMAFEVAQRIAELSEKFRIPYIFKGSYDKANRLSLKSKRGVGVVEGLEILGEIRESLRIPTLTDIHDTFSPRKAAMFVDCLQIPAFLCRQTDIVVSAAEAGLPLNIKKGQFVSPSDMTYIAEKARESGAQGVMLTERGTSFGYRDLIVDIRSIPIMAETGCPVVVDVSHCQQKPGSENGATGGDRRFIPHIASAALALEADAIYIEVHPDPDNAISDRNTQYPLDEFEPFLKFLVDRFG